MGYRPENGQVGFTYNDGGRRKAGYKGDAPGDCFCRAVAIATRLDYETVRTMINHVAKRERGRVRSSAYRGTFNYTMREVMRLLGWTWVPTMGVGKGCKVHLRADELPSGRIVVRVSKHVVALVNGTIHDLENCARGGTRCVYGYWYKK